MNTAILTYEGYSLFSWGSAYKSEVDGKWRQFDTAAQWVQYINLITGKK